MGYFAICFHSRLWNCSRWWSTRGADHGEGVVLIGEGEQRLTLHVGVGDVDAVEHGRVVVHDAEEVVVVAQQVLVGLRRRRGAAAAPRRGCSAGCCCCPG